MEIDLDYLLGEPFIPRKKTTAPHQQNASRESVLKMYLSSGLPIETCMKVTSAREHNASYKAALERLGHQYRYLYHANTVRTAITFLEEGGLLSRQEVEHRGLSQTPQFSDKEDKELGIFNDIWLDPVDNAYIGGINMYGPVLFRYSLDLLDTMDVPVRVTRSNPTGNSGHWTKDTPMNERYYSSADEFEAAFKAPDLDVFCHSFTFSVPMLGFEHLECVQIDSPGRDDQMYQEAVKALKEAAKKAGVKLYERKESMYKKDARTRGLEEYQRMSDRDFRRHFSPTYC